MYVISLLNFVIISFSLEFHNMFLPVITGSHIKVKHYPGFRFLIIHKILFMFYMAIIKFYKSLHLSFIQDKLHIRSRCFLKNYETQ